MLHQHMIHYTKNSLFSYHQHNIRYNLKKNPILFWLLSKLPSHLLISPNLKTNPLILHIFVLISKISLKRKKDTFNVHKAYTAELSDYKAKEQLSTKSDREKQDKSPTALTHSRMLRKRKVIWDPDWIFHTPQKSEHSVLATNTTKAIWNHKPDSPINPPRQSQPAGQQIQNPSWHHPIDPKQAKNQIPQNFGSQAMKKKYD